MIRPSALQLAETCSLSADLSSRFPEDSEAATNGRAIHLEIATAIATGEEPTSKEARNAVAYARGLADRGLVLFAETPTRLIDPETGTVITEGTPDLYAMGGRAGAMSVHMVDWKCGQQRGLPDPGESLQMHAYALAVATLAAADEYTLTYVVLDGDEMDVRTSRVFPASEWMPWIDRIKAIQTKPIAATVGSHCTAHPCYARRRCWARMLPAHEAETALAPFVVGGGLTSANATRALVVVGALKDAVERAEAQLRDYARANGGIPSEDGAKVWTASMSAGRTSVDTAALERDGLLAQYQKKGGGFETFRWKKAQP